MNLLDDPVIPVLGADGPALVSVLEALREAPRIQAIEAELPIVDAALTLLLLAIVVRGFTRAGKTSSEAWAEAWGAGELPDFVVEYAESVRPRFNLRDQAEPFLQTPGLATVKGPQPLELIVPGSGEGVFSTRRGQGLSSISADEAARWLITSQAYDPSGIKTPAEGDPRAQGGKVYPRGTGWAGSVGLNLICGSTLFETLMLNLRLRRDELATDCAVWERPTPGPLGARDGQSPLGPADFWTWPARRVLLDWDADGRAVGVSLTYGDRVDLAGARPFEWFARWKKTKATQVLYPRRHLQGQRRWNGLASLLAESQRGETEMPQIFEWLGRLQEDDHLPADQPIQVWAVGAIYGPQDSIISDLVSDTYSAKVALVTLPVLRQLVVQAAEQAELVGTMIGNYAANLARAGGQEPEGFRAEAKARVYELLEPQFDEWLEDLVDPDQSATYALAWTVRCRAMAQRIVDEMDPLISPAAITGRTLRVGQNEFYSDAGSVRARFVIELNKHFPRKKENNDE